MSLAEELKDARTEIKTDQYSTSIGEIASMYDDQDLEIHPEYQRFFRWTPRQKSQWIESLLLGLPTPPIFVAQRPDGVWDVVDGLQRLSTIFEFMGVLKDADGGRLGPLVLEATQYLPALSGKKYHDATDGANSLAEDQRRFFKRAKVDIKIILRESDPSSQYDLFRRLNTGGTQLTDQEVRNCVLVSIDPTFFEWLRTLSEDKNFTACLPIHARLVKEQYLIELALRFLAFRTLSVEEITGFSHLGNFLDRKSEALAEDEQYNRDHEAQVFRDTFSVLASALGEDVFKRYYSDEDRFKGAPLVSAFEVIALGLGHRMIPGSVVDAIAVADIVKTKVWEGAQVVTRTGESAPTRIPRTIKLGRDLFSSLLP